MKIWKKTAAVILAVCMISGVLGCTEGEEQEQDSETAEYYMYYVSPKETSLETAEYVPEELASEVMVQEISGMLSEDLGENINSYIHTSLNLYFANENGDRLKKENISVYYSSNVPLEREVVERLLKGPKSEELKPTLSPNTKILSVSIVEGICYVNLDKSFLTDSMDVQEELPLFSIVNSLTDACNVRGVQISVDGKTAVNFRESMKLDQIYHADYRLTEENQEEKEEKE